MTNSNCNSDGNGNGSGSGNSIVAVQMPVPASPTSNNGKQIKFFGDEFDFFRQTELMDDGT